MYLKTVEYYESGNDMGTGVQTIALATVNDEITNFASHAKAGTPIFCNLEKYEDLI